MLVNFGLFSVQLAIRKMCYDELINCFRRKIIFDFLENYVFLFFIYFFYLLVLFRVLIVMIYYLILFKQ